MKPDTEFFILLSVTILAFIIKTSYGLFMLSIMFLVYACNFFFTTYGLYTSTKIMENKIYYFKSIKTKENYNEIYSQLSEYYEIVRLMNLDKSKFIPCGIFFDDPNQKEKKESKPLHCCYGILFDKENQTIDIDNELKKRKFSLYEFRNLELVQGYYSSFFALNGSFIWLTKIITEMSMSKFFARVFNIKWKDKSARGCKKVYKKYHTTIVTLEEYQSNFYLPVDENESLLNLYSYTK